MREYVSNDGHEIIGNLPTVSVDQEGWYAFPVTLPDDVWNEVRSKDVSSFKFYALNDDGIKVEEMNLKPLSGDAVSPAFIMGLVNTWEIFSLTGEKLDNFGVKTFLMVGLLSAGKPFSFYLAKMILMLLMGGCSTGVNTAVISGVVIALIVLKLKIRKRH